MKTEILLVEDDRNEVDVVLRAIDRAGLRVDVSVASDGMEALEALGLESGETPPVSPEVVFLDLKMPRVDGFEVLRRLRADPRTASLPVVVVSSSDRGDDIRRSYALGANSFVLKRFDPRGPGSYLAEAARYWVGLNRRAREGSAR
ncbi:MAG: response regulator [Myxococcales bacterium]|nr:response regulator [Myxococcales bacterium]